MSPQNCDRVLLLSPRTLEFEFFSANPLAFKVFHSILENKLTRNELGIDLPLGSFSSKKSLKFEVDEKIIPFFLDREIVQPGDPKVFASGLELRFREIRWDYSKLTRSEVAQITATHCKLLSSEIVPFDTPANTIAAHIYGKDQLEVVEAFFQRVKVELRELLSRPSCTGKKADGEIVQFEMVVLGKFSKDAGEQQ